MRNLAKWVVGIVVAAVIVGGAGIAFIYSGLFNVSATYPDKHIVAWVMGKTMDQSVHRHAADIVAPDLNDPKMIQLGLSHYRSLCIECHGAPGVEIGATGKGLNPDPPELTEAAADWKPNELFWITKNGVRMTGMPAWGPSQSDKDIWAIIAFTRKLPTMTKEEYQKLSEQAPQVE